jgi:hypothetical protein
VRDFPLKQKRGVEGGLGMMLDPKKNIDRSLGVDFSHSTLLAHPGKGKKNLPRERHFF